jgi:hypothetical protein
MPINAGKIGERFAGDSGWAESSARRSNRCRMTSALTALQREIDDRGLLRAGFMRICENTQFVSGREHEPARAAAKTDGGIGHCRAVGQARASAYRFTIEPKRVGGSRVRQGTSESLCLERISVGKASDLVVRRE